MDVVYDLASGLDHLIPSPQYSGSLKYNTEAEYDSLVWMDARTKPSYTAAVTATLDVMRQYISDQIDIKTEYEIENSLVTTLDTSAYIHATREWQFNALNIYMQRATAFVTYPYALGVSYGFDGTVTYLTLTDATDVETLYSEMFAHVKGWLDSGRTLKNGLASLTKEQLLAYEDNR